jgi:hypothetical protein
MSGSVFSKLDVSKQRLSELQDELFQKGEEVRDQSQRLRDASVKRLFQAGATTLSTAAELLERVPYGQKRADLLRRQADSAQEASAAVDLPPIADYDELNVKQVREALEGLSIYELDKVRRYEKANKDRVTVLRDVDRLIA